MNVYDLSKSRIEENGVVRELTPPEMALARRWVQAMILQQAEYHRRRKTEFLMWASVLASVAMLAVFWL